MPGSTSLAVIGVLASVVGAFYYLRIVKLMYFDEPAAPFDRVAGRRAARPCWRCRAIVILFFFVYPGFVVDGADAVSAALFAG